MKKLWMLLLAVLCLPIANVFGESGITPAVGIATAVSTLPKVDTGDTAWVLMSAALVMLLTPTITEEINATHAF